MNQNNDHNQRQRKSRQETLKEENYGIKDKGSNEDEETQAESQIGDNNIPIQKFEQTNLPLTSDGEQLVLKHPERPDNVLMNPESPIVLTEDHSQIQEDEINTLETGPRRVLRTICLNPTFGLRTQLMLTFGSVSAFIISFVLGLSVIIAILCSENLKSVHEQNFKDRVRRDKGKVTRYLSESLTPKLIPDHVVRILYESVRDRFAGYPNDGDEFVPFFDIDSRTNKYPVVGAAGKSLPLDWQIDTIVHNDNLQEHIQGQWSWYDSESYISTADAFYFMQGICDPSVTDPSALTYWENCTDANNDIRTGGVVNPTPTNNQIYRKSRSLSPILKAVYESHQDIQELGIFFSNSGAGSGINFPHYLVQPNVTYTSIGCEWMNHPNPYDPSRPIGTKEEIERCHPEGTVVSSRVSNSLERDWCRRQALNPFDTVVGGPFSISWVDGHLLLLIGQAVYDRVTDNFIACTYIGWGLGNIQELLIASKVSPNSELYVARFDDGTTVASTNWNSSHATDTVKIYDLEVGLTLDDFDQLRTLVDFSKTWDPTNVREAYETPFDVRNDGFFITAYPIPPVPELYDPNYVPLFFVIMLTSNKDIFQVVNDVKTKFDDHLHKVIVISLIVGAVGLTTVLLIVYLMSKTLTAPLEYMNSSAEDIINHFGGTSFTTQRNESNTSGHRCSPRTELDDVVEEFDKLVTSFSRSFASGAKYVKAGQEEVRNGFNMREDFDELYKSRSEMNFAYRVGSIGGRRSDGTAFINFGSNINSDKRINPKVSCHTQERGGFTSRLFFWTVLLIGTPLLLTTIAMSAIVMSSMENEFKSSIKTAESFFLELQSAFLSVYATLRADLVSSVTSRSTINLHLLTRYTSWLLFGGVERAVSFTQVSSFLDQCKSYSNLAECPFYQENYFCDCAWNDGMGPCKNYTYNTRPRQILNFACQSSDALPNGDRNSTSFPNVSYSPESTSWWHDARNLPGSKKWLSASGYGTLYDRLRIISASPVHQVVYNRGIEKEYTVSSAVAFEADGLYVGFFGCNNWNLGRLVSWSSNDANGAYKIRPELCPKGKYGYDPRCSGWYDTGKKLAEANLTPLYVTPPYAFFGSHIGQTATSPLIDPHTKKYVGQVQIDIKSGPILDSLNEKNTPLVDGGFPILITSLFDADSVIGPGFSWLNESSKPISELVLPYDHSSECKMKIDQFEQIVSSMKNGSHGTTSFTRTSSGGSEERVFIAYAPVVVKGYSPIDSSDFSRGVEARDYAIYSLALAQPEGGLLEQFKQIEEDTKRIYVVAAAMLWCIIILSILFATYIAGIVTLSLSDTIFGLLDVINLIKCLNVNDEPPVVNRSVGSRELITVSETIHTLYKVVRCGNCAFLSGDLEKAYTILHDSFRLFCHLDNKEAVGVISNNLGNLLLVAFRAMDEAKEERCCGMTKEEVISKGISFYYDAIQRSEQVYDEFLENNGWSPNYLDVLQQLSNRYFNRGMFLLTVKDGHSESKELEKLGFRDLEVATDLDMEIVDSDFKAGLGHVTCVLKKFEIALVRAKRQVMLQELGYPAKLETGEILDDAFRTIKKKIKKDDDSLLFETIKPAGRLQEIETELIRYNLWKGEVQVTAQIGIRMLVEDEFIFPKAQALALEALSLYVDRGMKVDDDKKAELNPKLSTLKTTYGGVLNDMGKSRLSMYTANEESMKGLDGEMNCSEPFARRSTVRDLYRDYLTMEKL